MSGGSSVNSVADYAGDVSATEAWKILGDDPTSVLVDVRSAAEWTFVGAANLAELGKSGITISWQSFPGMVTNPFFVAEIKARDIPAEAPILLLCRSGVRSKAAAIALTSAGYERCYNIEEGFEGNHDEDKHRGRMGGWKFAGLPWVQG